jgi:hypothetical protein
VQGDFAAEPRDELGMGSLRDTLANAFFPGITTLQTRAKYFLFVPRMYREIEQERSRRVPAAVRIRQLEEGLLEGLRASGDHGVIGSQSWRVPQNPASGVYWSGLHKWGIRRFNNTRPHYHRWLDTNRGATRGSPLDEENAQRANSWYEPPDSDSLLTKPTMRLRRSHAQFLRDRILAIHDQRERPLLKDLVLAGATPADTPFWDLDASHEAALAELVADARLLSAALHGAMLVYNILCAELKEPTSSAGWRDWLNTWSEQHPRALWREWDIDAFWERVGKLDDGHAKAWTGRFLNSWLNQLRQHGPNDRSARRLISDRELEVKPGRARTAGAETLAGWNPQAGVAAQPMAFRWPQARTILSDIHDALGK